MSQTLIERTFAALERKELTAVLAAFSADATVIDPHYPRACMRGHPEIAEGLGWACGAIERFGFEVTAYYEGRDGTAAVEVATAHVLRSGMRLEFPQMFAVTVRDGLIVRLRAYTPHGPPGIGSLILGAVRLQWSARRLLRRLGPGGRRRAET